MTYLRTAETTRRPARRERGVAAILAMMFLVIFGSLAAAMAIVAEGNLHTADAHIKANRSLAAAETGLHFVQYRLHQVTSSVKTTDGEVSTDNAADLWQTIATGMELSLSDEFHNESPPVFDGNTLTIGPIRAGSHSNAPTFTATLTPHPLPGEDYDSVDYARMPYDGSAPETGITWDVSNAAPLDGRFIRLSVRASDGYADNMVTRTVNLDLQLTKSIPFAILSRSRIMIGKNVLIDGPIGTRFTEVDLEFGHPMQVASDFRGIDPDLDADLDLLLASLAADDQNGDNRLNIYNSTEVDGYDNPAELDVDGDGYIDSFDFFLAHIDSNDDGRVSQSELESKISALDAGQLIELIDTMGDPNRPGYNDGFVDADDLYAKIRGPVQILADKDAWEAGAADGAYQDHLQGPIRPDGDDVPVSFNSDAAADYSFAPEDFDVGTFRDRAVGDLLTQAANEAASYDAADSSSPQPLGSFMDDPVPFNAAYPYDWYERPVFKNMTFRDVKIPKGTNALFENCRFIGVTFVETETDNQDPNFNYAGMTYEDGTPKHADRSVTVDGTVVTDTKTISNNIRFHNCTFEGALVSDAPKEYTHTRNKLAFTGTTRWNIDGSAELSNDEKTLYKRSSMLVPHYSVELGTFVSPYDATETVELDGTIVTGLADLRGQVKINGSLLTTFEPKSNTGPVMGETSPNFNTTLGYFSADDGDLESELPGAGWGVIQVRYDPNAALPDGILGPVEVRPIMATYTERGE